MRRLHAARERAIVRIAENLGTFNGGALLVALLLKPDTDPSVAQIISSAVTAAVLWTLALIGHGVLEPRE